MISSIKSSTWESIRGKLSKVNPELAKIIDEISPNKSYKLYQANYPYGVNIVKNGVLQIPNNHGENFPITHSETPNDIKNNLSYNLNTNPVSIVLKNSVEIFLSHENHTLSLYGLIKPGHVFSTWYILGNNFESNGPPFLWDMTSGARSFFLLSKISNQSGYARLRKVFSLSSDKPKLLIDHWNVFREIANSDQFNQPWETELLFFGKKWFDDLDDTAFSKLQTYLFKNAWRGSDYARNQFIWNFIYSTIQRKKGIKIDPYIAETVKHLFGMASGYVSGFAPSIDNIAAPLDGLRDAYNEVYRMHDYQPVFMEPHVFGSDSKIRPVYYSIEYPSTMEFSSRSRDDKNKIQDLILIKSLVNKYLNELSDNHLNVGQTPIGSLNKTAEFSYFHTTSGYHSIENSSLIPSQDKYFQVGNNKDSRNMPVNSTFLRGCIRINKKN